MKFWNFKSIFLFMPLPFKYLPFYYLLIYRTTNARNRVHSATKSGPYFFHFDYFTKRSHFPYKNFKLVTQIVASINWAENLCTSSKQYVLKLWQTKRAYLWKHESSVGPRVHKALLKNEWDTALHKKTSFSLKIGSSYHWILDQRVSLFF